MFKLLLYTFLVAEENTIKQLLAKYPKNYDNSTDKFKLIFNKRSESVKNGLGVYNRFYKDRSELTYIIIHNAENLVPDIVSNPLFSTIYLISPTMGTSVVEEVKGKIEVSKKDFLGGPYYLQCKNFDRIEEIMEEVAEFIQQNIPERLRSELVER